MHLRLIFNIQVSFFLDSYFFFIGLQVIAKITFEVKSGKKNPPNPVFFVSVSLPFTCALIFVFSFWIEMVLLLMALINTA